MLVKLLSLLFGNLDDPWEHWYISTLPCYYMWPCDGFTAEGCMIWMARTLLAIWHGIVYLHSMLPSLSPTYKLLYCLLFCDTRRYSLLFLSFLTVIDVFVDLLSLLLSYVHMLIISQYRCHILSPMFNALHDKVSTDHCCILYQGSSDTEVKAHDDTACWIAWVHILNLCFMSVSTQLPCSSSSSSYASTWLSWGLYVRQNAPHYN